MKPWDGIISEEDQKATFAAGFGRPSTIGKRPALLIIDVQYRTIGTSPKPILEAIKEFPTSCGDVGWNAMRNIALLLAEFRRNEWPVLYPHVAPKNKATDGGRLAEKVPAIMDVPAKGYDFPAEIAPREGDVLIPKKHPSAFFATPLASHLIDLGADTLVVTGCTTSGCVRQRGRRLRLQLPRLRAARRGVRPLRDLARGEPVRHGGQVRRRGHHRRNHGKAAPAQPRAIEERERVSEAVLVLDMTRDSIAPEARAVEMRRAILPRTAAYLAWARGKGMPVVFVCSARRRTDKWFLKFWELANEIWQPGQQPIPALFQPDQDTVVHKRRYSGFFGSDLELTLRELDVDALQLVGWSTSLAVATTAVDAWQLGLPTTVVSDLTIAHAWGGHSVEENQKWSLDFIAAMAKSKIVRSDELMR